MPEAALAEPLAAPAVGGPGQTVSPTPSPPLESLAPTRAALGAGQAQGDYLNLVLSRHVTQAGQAGLGPSGAIDLAGLDADVRSSLGDGSHVPAFDQPSAVGDLLHHLVSSQVDQIPVTDLADMQARLQQAGYLPTGPTNGLWDPPTQRAYYRAGTEAARLMSQGHGQPGSLSVATGMRLLDFMTPSTIVKSLEGFAGGIGKSLWGTVTRGYNLAAHHDAAAWQDFRHHWVGDVINVLSVASMFTGLGELADAARLGMGLTTGVMGDAVEQAAARAGIDVTRSAFSVASPDQLARFSATGQGLTRWFLSKAAGEGVADRTLSLAARYGPSRVAQGNLGILAGKVYGAAARMSFAPNMAAVLEPHSDLGRAVNASRGVTGPLASLLDASTLATSTPAGLSPLGDLARGAGRLADLAPLGRITRLGHELPLAHTGLADGEKLTAIAGAWADHLANERVLAQGVPEGWSEQIAAKAQARDTTAAQVFDQPGTPGATLKPDALPKALAWARQNPSTVNLWWESKRMDEMAAVRRGLPGGDPAAAEREVSSVIGQANDRFARNLPQMGAVAAQVRDARAVASSAEARLTAAVARGDTERLATFGEDAKAARAEADRLTELWRASQEQTFYHSLTTPLTGRVSAQRADFGATNQAATRMLGDLAASGNASPAARAGLIDTLRPELAAMGLSGTPDARLEAELRAALEHLPHEITLPGDENEVLARHGYRAVLSRAPEVTPSMVSPAVAAGTPKLGALYGLQAHLGLSLDRADPEMLRQWIHTNLAGILDTRLHAAMPDLFEAGDGWKVRDALAEHLSDLRAAAAKVADAGPGFAAAAQAASLRSLADLNSAEISKVMNGMGVDPDQLRRVTRLVHSSVLQSPFMPGMTRSPAEMYLHLSDLARALRLEGLPGLSGALRAMTVHDGLAMSRLNRLPVFDRIEGNYGHLADRFARAAAYWRYQLNPLHQLRVFAERQAEPALRLGIVPPLHPRAALDAAGETAHAFDVLARATGRPVGAYRDLEQTALSGHLLHYDRNGADAYLASKLHARAAAMGMDDEAAVGYVRDNLAKLDPYASRSPALRSVNMVLFPLGFQMHIVHAAHDIATSGPVQALATHELVRRLASLEQMDDNGKTRFANFVDRHAPLLNELNGLNPFGGSIGVKANLGVYGDAARAIGTAPQALLGLLSPQGVSDANVKQWSQLAKRAVPVWREANDLFTTLGRQAPVLAGREATQGQIDDFMTSKQALEARAEREDAAHGGLGTMASFRASSRVPARAKAAFEAQMAQLGARYPEGAAYLASRPNLTALDTLKIDDILQKTNKTRAEQGVVALEALRAHAAAHVSTRYGSAAAKAHLKLQLAQAMRDEGLRLLKVVGPGFADTWRGLGYLAQFGPIVSPRPAPEDTPAVSAEA